MKILLIRNKLKGIFLFTGKNQNFRKFQEYTSGTTFEPNIYKKGVNEEVTTMVELHPQSSQRLDDGIKHTSGQNDRLRIWLKAIQGEYYYIRKQKS